MQLKPGMLFEPRLHLGGLVSPVVVEGKMRVEAPGHDPVDLLEEPDELLDPMPGQAFADDLAGGHVEGRKQDRRAVPLVIVRHGSRTALFEGQAGLRAIERLDLAFLVDGENDGFFRRIEIEPDDVLDLLAEVRIVGDKRKVLPNFGPSAARPLAAYPLVASSIGRSGP